MKVPLKYSKKVILYTVQIIKYIHINFIYFWNVKKNCKNFWNALQI